MFTKGYKVLTHDPVTQHPVSLQQLKHDSYMAASSRQCTQPDKRFTKNEEFGMKVLPLSQFLSVEDHFCLFLPSLVHLDGSSSCSRGSDCRCNDLRQRLSLAFPGQVWVSEAPPAARATLHLALEDAPQMENGRVAVG